MPLSRLARLLWNNWIRGCFYFGWHFRGKKFITLGPTNATAVLLFGMFANLGMIQRSGQISESAIILVPCILFASGLILLFASLLRVSFFVKFISRTVITAYITAASLLIIANQIKNTLGITALPENPITNFTSSINFVVLNIIPIVAGAHAISYYRHFVFNF